MRIKILFTAFFIGLLGFSSATYAENDPVANPKAQVVSGNARFTVLTDRLIRMEWSENGKFEDNATLAIINRNLPVPAFTTAKSGSGVQIRTSAVTLNYSGNGRFDKENLSVSFKLNGKTVTWYPGKEDTGNLMVVTPGKKKLVAVSGLKDFIVIDTDDVLLICPKDDKRFKDFISGIAMPEYEKYR